MLSHSDQKELCPVPTSVSDDPSLSFERFRPEFSEMTEIRSIPKIRRRSMVRSRTVLPKRSQSARSEEHTSELQSPYDLVCRLLLENKTIHQVSFLSPARSRLAALPHDIQLRLYNPRTLPSRFHPCWPMVTRSSIANPATFPRAADV